MILSIDELISHIVALCSLTLFVSQSGVSMNVPNVRDALGQRQYQRQADSYKTQKKKNKRQNK